MKTATFRTSLPIAPVPASRPRVTRRGHVYYGKSYSKFRAEAGRFLERFVPPKDLPIGADVELDVTFYCRRPKTTKRSHPRGDVDNYLKTLDVLNGILWHDDDQIIRVNARKEFSDEPRIELEVTYGEFRET